MTRASPTEYSRSEEKRLATSLPKPRSPAVVHSVHVAAKRPVGTPATTSLAHP